MTSPKNYIAKIIVLLTCVLFLFCSICVVSAQSGTIVNASASASQPQVGSTLTVALTIANVQNLGGIDTTLQWNNAVLNLKSSTLNLGGNGVLHGTVNTDSNNESPGDILVQENKVAGSYELIATEVGQTYSGFTGSGTIVTLTFDVVGIGSAGLTLQSDLADHPASGQTANNIAHQDTASAVTTIAQGSTGVPTTTTSSSPAPSPSVPEFTGIIVLSALVVAASAVIVLSAKRFRKR
jgi:hypothetical protein